jgi:hypothetical protein
MVAAFYNIKNLSLIEQLPGEPLWECVHRLNYLRLMASNPESGKDCIIGALGEDRVPEKKSRRNEIDPRAG